MIKKLLFILFCILISLPSLKAQQIKGGEITYKWTGNSNFMHRYEISLVLLTDVKLLPNSDIKVLFKSSCFAMDSISMATQPTGNIFVCFPSPFSNHISCVDSSLCDHSYLNILKGTVNLPDTCRDWVFYYNQCCRDSNSANIINPESENFYVEAKLNSTYGPNTSPYFGNIPSKTFCLNSDEQIVQAQNMIEMDGDSISMELSEILGDSGKPIPFETGYSIQQPFHSNPPISFDNINDILSFKPTVIEKVILKFKVDEYRRDSSGSYFKIGHIMRDAIINFAPVCSDDQINISFDSPIVNIFKPDCGDSILLIKTDFLYQNSTLSSDGSEFLVINKNGKLDVDSAFLINGYTNIAVYLTNPLVTADSLTLVMLKGNDGNTIISDCGFLWPENDSISFAVDCYFDLEEINLSERIFPNPVMDVLHLEGLSSKNAEVSIYNLSGQLILKTVLAENGLLDVSDIKSGTYILMIKDAEKLFYHKIVKN